MESSRQRILFAGMSRILVAEDDADIAALIRHYLEKAGFTVDLTESGRDVLPRLRRSPVDAVILDVMLPGMDGFDVCRAMRADPTTAAVPVIMLTAKAEESDRIVGLELGADDYITKPFSPGEVVARVRALLRRSNRSAPASGTLSYGPLSLDADRHVVTITGREVRLTAKEFLLLQYLLQHRGRVLSRDLLLSDVWDYAYTGGTRTVDVHVRRLREKLPFLTEALVTVKQFGYKLLDPPPPGAPARRV
jgi:DNA-binding response OmpR family regulator